MATTQTLLRVGVSDAVLTKFETEAARRGKTVEAVVAERLAKFADVDSTKPVVINDTSRQQLEKLMGRNFSTADELVASVQRAMSCKIDSIEIPLTPYLLDRLKTRCLGVEFGKFMQSTVKRLLEEFAGMR